MVDTHCPNDTHASDIMNDERLPKMDADRAVFLMNQMLWASLVVAAPILLATLLVGLLISVFQVATQIQEITLSYVPKIAVAAILTMVLGGWMINQITQFAIAAYASIPSLGR
jgi:flagellar biosynthesis protein FliQ